MANFFKKLTNDVVSATATLFGQAKKNPTGTFSPDATLPGGSSSSTAFLPSVDPTKSAAEQMNKEGKKAAVALFDRQAAANVSATQPQTPLLNNLQDEQAAADAKLLQYRRMYPGRRNVLTSGIYG